MENQNAVNKRRGAWVLTKVLGSGGFGQVTLWEHEKQRGEKIAIKQCRVILDAKNCKRWTMEIDIMKRLDNTFVCRSMDVPLDLQAPSGDIPVLGMEYCVGGDLRKVLLKAENACGLKQSEVLDVAKHTASGVEYLHSNRIIHRDLKPENIVIQQEDGRKLYKLIDLGYAKELDQGSVASTFVGTLQYLAPELYASRDYTVTVDFWSLGTVIFECITGKRPFLPSLPPVQWHGTVSQKKDSQITAYESPNGEMIFSEHLLSPNHLSRPYQNLFEYWLKYMLLWDSTSRGGGPDDKKRPKCFGILDRIIECKVLNVLCMVDDSLQSYIAQDSDTLTTLQQQLAKDTGIPIEEQEILLPTGMAADSKKPALQCWGGREQQDLTVFLFHRGQMPTSFQKKPLPELVQIIVDDAKTLMPYQDRKKIWGQACCYCGQQMADCSRLLEGARAAMLCVLRLNTALNKERSKLTEQLYKLQALQEHFRVSLELDVDMYAVQAANGITSEKMFRNWKTTEKEVVEFAVTGKVHKLDYRVNAIQTRVVELQRSPFARMRQADTLIDTEQKATGLYQELRQSGREEAHIFQDNTKMAVLVLKCISQRQKITKELCSHLGKLMTCKQDIEKMMPEISQCLEEMKEFETKIIMFQKQRQKDIWTLLRYVMQNFHRERAGSRRSSSGNSAGATTPESPNIRGLVSMPPDKLSQDVMTESFSTKERFDEAFESIKSDLQQNAEDSSGLDWTFIDVANHAPASSLPSGIVMAPPRSSTASSTILKPLSSTAATAGSARAESTASSTISKPQSSTAGSAKAESTASGGEFQG
ncbi:inhibitor of nuclear factor kappa-B kinase subunit alpha-like [Amphiura filiformis]|uniref:inhibitor of nuclear factor kappa-B kinase subunit alpha-like n=1 Tax=Amphiura filiformis TaxID=82378 RepID=UPI003B222021